MGTKADKKAAKATKATKATKVKAVAEPIVKAQTDATDIQPTGDESTAVVQTAVAKVPRIKKNATEVDLDITDPDSAMNWHDSFIEQGEKHPARKGYDQHWNSEGFIHAGPAKRLPNKGAAKMMVFLANMLAQRAIDGDSEASATLDFCNTFGGNVKGILEDAKNASILAAADAIRAKQIA